MADLHALAVGQNWEGRPVAEVVENGLRAHVWRVAVDGGDLYCFTVSRCGRELEGAIHVGELGRGLVLVRGAAVRWCATRQPSLFGGAHG